MKASTWFFLLAAGGLIVAAAATVLRPQDETARESFERLQQEIAKGYMSVEEILEDLDDVLTRAEEEGDGATATDVRRRRGSVFLDLGAHDQARRDFETVLDVVEKDDAVEGLLVELEKRAGNLDSAIARVERRLEDNPSSGDVWVQAADVYVRSGDKRIEDCLESLSRVLISSDEAIAEELLVRGAALDPSDPLRVAVGHDLWQLFASEDDQKRQEALAAMDAASDDLRRARRSYARSLELIADPKAVAGLLDLLARSRHDEETLDLGIASLPYDEVRDDPETGLILIRTLRESGHLSFAAEFANRWAFSEETAPNAPLYAECCRTLLEHESWGPLINSANRLGLTTDPRLVPHSNLYRGLGLTNREDYTRARSFLTKWLDISRGEPFPGARTVAWQHVARCWDELDQPNLERAALEQAVAAGADFDGETWLKLARLQAEARHGGYRTPEERWARGMAGSDWISDEIDEQRFDRWVEMGERELETTAFDPAAEHRNMVRTETWNPRTGLSPYELFRLAQEHEKGDDPERALMTHRRLLEDIPGFPPSIDRSIEIAMDLGYEREAAELLLKRMERTGRDEYAQEVISDLDLELLERDDLLLLMRLDPELTGRRRIAQSFDRDEYPERALTVIGDLYDETLAPELVWYGLDLMIQIGRFDEVTKRLDAFDDDELSDPEHLAVLIEAYVGARRQDRIDELIGFMLGNRSPRKDVWLRSIDRLLDAGYTDQARKLIERLDKLPSTTGGDVLVRACVDELLSGNLDEALRYATRAQAFDTGGAAELIHLIALVELERYTELRSSVDFLRQVGYPTTAYQDLALLLLEDDLPRAREAADIELEDAPHDPFWMLLSATIDARYGETIELPLYFGDNANEETETLLFGRATSAGDAIQDSRRVAALILALDDPIASLWARGALAQLDPSEERMWPTFLRHAAPTTHEHRSVLQASMEQLTERFPRFGPAWDQLDELVRADVDERESVERIEIRVRRQRALGDAVTDPLEIALDNARREWLEKHPRRAAQYAREATEIDPESLVAHRIVGALHALNGRFDIAVEGYDAALPLARPDSNLTIVADALEVYQRAQQRGDLDLQGHGERLAAVAERFPDDPAVPLARAEHELIADKHNPALGVARAYAHLDRFLEDHPRTSLEDLRSGSTVNWGRFLLALDPERAESFARAQLLAKPGSLELWIFTGEILQAIGDLKGALQHVQTVHRMAPRDGRVLRKLAELEVKNGVPRAFIARRIQQVREVQNLKDTDPQLSYWRAMAIMGVGSRGIVGSLSRLRQVWKHRYDLPSYLAVERVGLRYASALIARGHEEDRTLAREVLSEFQDSVTDPYQRDLATALFGLSLHDSAPGATSSPR